MSHFGSTSGTSGQFQTANAPSGTTIRRLLVESAFTCDQCRRLSVGGVYSDATNAHDPANFWRHNSPTEWAPSFIEGQNFPDVPEQIARAAGEAHKGASIGNHMSAILMARTVIEATAKDKGITVRGLQPKIEALREQEFIREHVKEEAHEIRHFGNDMAHGDLDIPVVAEDALEVLTLMDEILDEVYQSPARLVAARERRLARQDLR